MSLPTASPVQPYTHRGTEHGPTRTHTRGYTLPTLAAHERRDKPTRGPSVAPATVTSVSAGASPTPQAATPRRRCEFTTDWV